jgi:cell division protein FtsA
MGGGTTSLGVFVNGRCMHVDSIPIGGERVTSDITHGLSIGFTAAERLKTLYGSAIASESDMRESIVVRRSSEDGDEGTQYIQRSELVRIIKPRIEEIFEIVGERIAALGCSLTTGWSLILTGGASQLSGVAEVAARVLAPEKRILTPDGSYAIVGGARVRIGRPLGVRGLIEEAKGPAFAASVGMLVYPQVLHREYKEDKASLLLNAYTGKEERVLSRVGRWIRENF